MSADTWTSPDASNWERKMYSTLPFVDWSKSQWVAFEERRRIHNKLIGRNSLPIEPINHKGAKS